MKRKIKFPLTMNKETSVRTIEELRNNFNIEEVIEYFFNGKLEIWLRDRNYNSQLEKILKLDINKKSFNTDLCLALDVDCKDYAHVDAKEIEDKNKRLKEIKKHTDKKSILDKVDEIIFTQEELNKRLKELGKNNKNCENAKIYLCGVEFSIIDNFENISYIGVNKSIINLTSKGEFDAKSKNIKFENLKVTSKYNIDLIIKEDKLFEIDAVKINLRKCSIKYCKNFIRDVNNNKYVIDTKGDLRKFSWFNNDEQSIYFPKFKNKIVDIDSDSECFKFIAVDEDGNVYQWGELQYLCKSIPNNLPKIVQVSTDGETFIALDENGRIHCWGESTYEEEFNEKVHKKSTIPYKNMPNINSRIIQVTCKSGVVMVVDELGIVYSWGINLVEKQQIHDIPKDLPPIKKVALYNSFVFAIGKNGKVYFWGEKKLGNNNIPKNLPSIVDITDLNRHIYSALDEEGKIHIWGNYSDKYKNEVEKLPLLINLVDLGGLDEKGNIYGMYDNKNASNIIGKISSEVKSMIPII